MWVKIVCFFFFKQKTAYEMELRLEFRRVLFRSLLHTLTGQPSQWVRFECNDTLPRQPDDFKFSGIDGRGRQTLIRDPRGNRGVAVIRIEDPKSGSEGYTFDIEWRGFGNNNGRGRYEENGRENRETGRAIEACKD